jgi:hypothetical protein
MMLMVDPLLETRPAGGFISALVDLTDNFIIRSFRLQTVADEQFVVKASTRAASAMKSRNAV